MNIIPLDHQNVDEAIQLLNSVFPDDIHTHNNPEVGLRSSLDPKKYKEYWGEFQTRRSNFFVLLDDKREKIIGTTGIYQLETDPKERAWLGWFCIEPSQRGRGFGKKLLEWTLDRAREEGYKKIRLYTSDEPTLATAQILYKKMGFKEVGRKKEEEYTWETVYKEVEL